MRPQAAYAMVVVERTRVVRSHRFHPAFPAQWFTAYIALSPATGSFATVARGVASTNLTPASGCQDHTTSPSASGALVLKRHPRPPHPAPRFVTLRNAPLWDGTAGNREVIWVFGKAEYFCGEALTQGSKNNPTSKSVGRFNPTPASS